jgi:hypothetical protein
MKSSAGSERHDAVDEPGEGASGEDARRAQQHQSERVVGLCVLEGPGRILDLVIASVTSTTVDMALASVPSGMTRFAQLT